MAILFRRRLPRGKAGLMINHVMRFPRLLVYAVAISVVAAVRVAPARAQSSDDGWFDDGSGHGAAPAPSVPRAPASPERPAEPQSLAPSPLLEDDAQASSAEDQDPRALTAWNSYVDPYGSWVDDPRYGRIWMPNGSVVGRSLLRTRVLATGRSMRVTIGCG